MDGQSSAFRQACLLYSACPLLEKSTSLTLDDDNGQGENKEKNTQPNGDPEKGFFNSTPGGKHAAGICARQTAKTHAFVLQHNTYDQGN